MTSAFESIKRFILKMFHLFETQIFRERERQRERIYHVSYSPDGHISQYFARLRPIAFFGSHLRVAGVQKLGLCSSAFLVASAGS